MPEFRIRDLDRSDLAAAAIINDANTPAVGAATAGHLGRLLDMSQIALAAESDDGRLAGFCLVLGPGQDYTSINYRWFASRYERFIYLDRVAVDEWARNAGVGTALYAEVERRTDAPWFLLEVNLRPRNDGSLRFHERLGFREVDQQETDYGVLVSLLAKPLT